MLKSYTRRTAGQYVTVLCESATEMSLSDAVFDGVVCFTMLHHVPSRALQDQCLRRSHVSSSRWHLCRHGQPLQPRV